ncbi:uncharacterized protein [Antedon mediterranea]|uniref:uncharacterized protein n=1 Tax=Antedon mediterranea TaxID=105859 RepID=UPI003AF727F1
MKVVQAENQNVLSNKNEKLRIKQSGKISSNEHTEHKNDHQLQSEPAGNKRQRQRQRKSKSKEIENVKSSSTSTNSPVNVQINDVGRSTSNKKGSYQMKQQNVKENNATSLPADPRIVNKKDEKNNPVIHDDANSVGKGMKRNPIQQVEKTTSKIEQKQQPQQRNRRRGTKRGGGGGAGGGGGGAGGGGRGGGGRGGGSGGGRGEDTSLNVWVNIVLIYYYSIRYEGFSSAYLPNEIVKRTSHVVALNFTDLNSILQKKCDPVECLSYRTDHLNKLLKDEKMGNNVVEVLLQVYVRIFKCEISESREKLVDMLKSSSFLKKIVIPYVTHLGDKFKIDGNKNEDEIQKNTATLLNLVWKFLNGVTSEIREVNDVALITNLLDVKSKELFGKRKLSQDALINVARFKKETDKWILEFKEAEKKKRELESAKREGISDGPPPDDYRDIPILPTTEDLHSKELPFLRPNKIKGSYASQYHYLDVQFRLLREDFICPLREGIQIHLDNVANAFQRNQRKRNTDVRLYYDVNIEHPVISQTEHGVLHRVQFSLCNLKNIRWKNTKRLIFGSLVCLSHDNFQTLLFGTVCNRDESLLQQGRVDIKFHNAGYMEITRLNTCTMVESTAFFESYRPVLQVLQQFDDDNILPMDKYIIRASHDIERPKYLRNTPKMMYDIRPLLKVQAKDVKSRYLHSMVRCNHMVDILDDEKDWLKIDNLALDQSQITAVKSALTKEIAVIQGPPGTGKTYIGLKVVETLLINKHRWATSSDKQADEGSANIIMVICYTNHALDQFLEGILRFCDNLARIGGRSKSETLKTFNLKELVKKTRRKKGEFRSVKELAGSITSRMVEAEEMIKLCDKYIISEFTLEKVINENHLKCLRDSRAEYGVDEKRSALPTWLGLLSDSENNEQRTEDIAIKDDTEYDKDNETEPNGNANITTEFDMMLDQRDYDISAKLDYESEKNVTINALAYDPEMKCKDAPLKQHQATVERQLSVIGDEMTEHEANRVNIRLISTHNKWRLYRFWITKYKGQLREILFEEQQAYDQVVGNSIKEEDNKDKCEALSGIDVIGMTTTGAAKNKELLNRIRPRIVVVEEAAEILEAHIVTSLTKQCEQIILIGDHQQLKPNPTVYKLATKFNLDTSLFERMLTNDVPCQKLSSQHRMRPQISEIMRKHFYSHLLDDKSVKEFDNVKGVAHNLFFINHDIQEESVEDILSKSNAHEAEYCVAFAKYLYQQGYDASSITILTTYTGQVLNLKRLLKDQEYNCLRDVYVNAVDNYQGEENEIILLSLVRSNEAGNIGFLKVSNRMCVALSRAKKGMFCIGNFKLLSEKNDLWMKIVNDMQNSNCFGSYIEVYCQNHPATKVKLSTADDFIQCPMGGCRLLCETRLNCGHVCPFLCHPRDPNHEKFECKENCVRLCRRNHACYLMCFVPCLPCKVVVSTTLECLHEVKLQCYKLENPVRCTKPCEKLLKCEHKCKELCFEKCTSKCLQTVKKLFSPCGHNIEVQCYITSCQLPCEKTLACGHVCKMKCGEACETKCTEIIEKEFECGHTVSVPCFTQTCPLPCSQPTECGHPCPNTCGNSCNAYYICKSYNHHHDDGIHVHCKMSCQKTLTCGHQCRRQCYEVCSTNNCTEVVTKILVCSHEKEVPCNVDGKHVRCKMPCQKTLSCGHQCRQKCYQICFSKLCTELVTKILVCNHEKEVPCNVEPIKKTPAMPISRHSYRSVNRYKDLDLRCNAEVTKIRKCGHETNMQCYESKDLEYTDCLENVVETLECGHTIKRICSEIKVCSSKCSRLLPCGHKCKNLCCKPCTELCREKVDKELKCGHMKKVQCFVDVSEIATSGEAACLFKLTVNLPCGHERTQLCCQRGQPFRCEKRCTKDLLCGHTCAKKCFEECSIDSCQEQCKTPLVCGHRCRGKCKDCSHGKIHKACMECCNKNLICGHNCQQPCSMIPCQPCKKRCESGCWHKHCQRSCSDICEPCGARCKWKCIHFICTQNCDDLCNRERCNQPCRKTLTCEHKCFGLCGEPCQNKCLTCNPYLFYPAKSAGKSRPRYVFLYDCSHAIDVSTMDEYMDKDEGIRLKQCPVCHTIIRFNPRYGNVLKTINMRIADIKRKMRIERSIDRVQDMRQKINYQLQCLCTFDQEWFLQEMNSRYGIKYQRLLLFDIMTTMLKQLVTIRDDLNQQSETSYIADILQQLETIQQRIWNSENIVSEQFVFHVSSEIQRINTCVRLMKFQCKTVSDKKTDTLSSIILHNKSHVTSEIMQEALDMLGKDDQLPKVVVLVKETVSRCLSFCQESWSTCSFGHLPNGNNADDAEKCSASEMKVVQAENQNVLSNKNEKLRIKQSGKISNNEHTEHKNDHQLQSEPTRSKRQRQRQRKSKSKEIEKVKSSSKSTNTLVNAQTKDVGRHTSNKKGSYQIKDQNVKENNATSLPADPIIVNKKDEKNNPVIHDDANSAGKDMKINPIQPVEKSTSKNEQNQQPQHRNRRRGTKRGGGGGRGGGEGGGGGGGGRGRGGRGGGGGGGGGGVSGGGGETKSIHEQKQQLQQSNRRRDRRRRGGEAKGK